MKEIEISIHLFQFLYAGDDFNWMILKESF